MDLNYVKQLLIEDEGYKKFPYKCTAGKTTIGVGRNLDDKGLSDNEIMYLLENDIFECQTDLMSIFKTWNDIHPLRQAVLLNMRFNLGPSGFRTFKNFIKAIEENNIDRAIYSMINSKWYKQVKKRGPKLVKIMREAEQLGKQYDNQFESNET